MRLLPLGLLLALVAAGCGGPSEAHVITTQVRDGIAVQMTLGATHDGLSVEARIENQRTEPLVLRQDGCGYAGVAEVARTTHQPRGRTWSGSIKALKRLVLEDQAASEAPEPMTAVRKKCEGDGSAETLTLKPGAVVREHWISRAHPSMLDVVGSKHAVARLQIFEPDEKAPTVAVKRLVSAVANWKISYPEGRSDGQRFDTLLADRAVRRALAAEPAASWREAALSVVAGADELKAVSARYERAFLAVGDGKRVQLVAPGPEDRVVPYPEAPVDLPPGIHVIPEPEGSVATHDVLAGALQLPSGRLAVDSVFDERTPVVDERARPGAHPFRVTLAKPVGGSIESVALATLVASDRPTVRWRYVLTVAVDGTTAMFSSVEGARIRAALAPEDSAAENDADIEALAARLHVADRELGRGTNLMTFETGAGDGGYNLYVGLDADGHPTRYVLDTELLHLDWPKPPKKEKA
jgi:Protein of unknown function (DUF4241)